jgi:hypothetical protein
MDARPNAPSVNQFRRRLLGFAHEMLAGADRYRRMVEAAFPRNERLEPICLHLSASDLDKGIHLRNLPKPKLILTSPPYPGVHMLYHRWQVDGRKESPAPFWIANQLDGSGAKYYMLGDHREMQLRRYYNSLLAAFLSVRRICASDTLVIQLVAFADPDWQLPRYLEVMSDAGFRELVLPGNAKLGDGRFWRKVPNRRWHADRLGETSSSNEVVLVHTPVATRQLPQHYPKEPHDPRLTH